MLCDSAIEVKSQESDILSNYSPFRVKISQEMPVKKFGPDEQNIKIDYEGILEGLSYFSFSLAQRLF